MKKFYSFFLYILLVVFICLIFVKLAVGNDSSIVLPTSLIYSVHYDAVEVTDDEIYEEMLYQNIRYVTTNYINNRVSEIDDIVYFDIEFISNSFFYNEHIVQQDYLEIHDKDSLLVGKSVGDCVIFDLENYFEINNHTIHKVCSKTKIVITEIIELVKPEIDDDFVRKHTSFSSLQEYRGYIKERIYNLKVYVQEKALGEEILKNIIKDTSFNEDKLNKSIEKRYREIISRYEEYASIQQVDLASLLSYYNTSYEKLYLTATENEKKSQVSSEIVKRYKLASSKKDYDNACIEYITELGYKTIEEFINDNSEQYLFEKVNERIAIKYLISIAEKSG